MLKSIKKSDIILFFVLVALGLILSAFSFAYSNEGEKAVITVDGKVYGTYPLDEDKTIEITQGDALNKITIKNGYVQMTYSTCKNQICVNEKSISKTNESIVCLPNKVMIRITGGKEELDAVTN